MAVEGIWPNEAYLGARSASCRKTSIFHSQELGIQLVVPHHSLICLVDSASMSEGRTTVQNNHLKFWVPRQFHPITLNCCSPLWHELTGTPSIFCKVTITFNPGCTLATTLLTSTPATALYYYIPVTLGVLGGIWGIPPSLEHVKFIRGCTVAAHQGYQASTSIIVVAILSPICTQDHTLSNQNFPLLANLSRLK